MLPMKRARTEWRQINMKERSSPGMLVAVFCLILHMANGQSPAPKAGEPADLVNFGRVTGWADLEDEHAYAKDAGPPWRAIAEQNAHDQMIATIVVLDAEPLVRSVITKIGSEREFVRRCHFTRLSSYC